MKKVTIKEMTLINFRGHQNLKVHLSNETTISGDNRLGKSTVFDAFVWLLFGKDQFDRKDHEIIPIIGGKRLERVDSEVSATIDVDGREICLKRVLHQKWVRRRGTAEEVFDGTETQFFWDDVPLKAGEYKSRVDLLIEESIFKYITNPASFLSLHWTNQREILFTIAGTISDVQIAESKAEFRQLLDTINGKSFAEFKKEISARKRKLNESLETIGPRIDQTAKLMPEKKDWNAIEENINLCDLTIKGIDEQLTDRSKAIRGQYEEIQQKQAAINELKTKQRDLINQLNQAEQQKAFDQNQNRIKLQNELSATARLKTTRQSEFDEARRSLDNLKAKSLTISNEVENLREKWHSENAKEYKGQSDCLVCPVFGTSCGDPAAQSKHVEATEKAIAAFFQEKERKLDEINTEGKKKTEELGFINTRVQDAETYLKEAETNLANAGNEHARISNELANTPEVVAELTDKPADITQWVELQEGIAVLTESIVEIKPVDNSDLNTKKAELVAKRDQLKKDLSDRELISRYHQEIEKLKAEASELSQQIADIEKTEFAMAEFTKVKIDESERRINSLFQIVKFQLYDKTIDGNEFECCIALNKAGVPISATNTAERINAGLDIIRTLSGFYNVSAPIFCDQAESNNNYLKTGSQMVFLRVTKEPVLTVSNF
jgi:DNA repair protein SbcC/Rad50